VARGFQQTQGLDCDETFTSIAHMTVVRTLIVVAASSFWTISHMDVKNVFLHSVLHEVNMHPPPGVDIPFGHVCRLRKALYGLKQSPRAWFQRLVTVIRTADFSPSDHDPALFLHSSSQGRTLLLLYIDDMLIMSNDLEHISQVKQHLSEQFKMSYLGPLGYFLGMRYYNLQRDIISHGPKYIQDLIARSSLSDNRTAVTPMDIHLQLCSSDGSPLQDPSRYRHIVGSLV
jgi:hypothetical protein